MPKRITFKTLTEKCQGETIKRDVVEMTIQINISQYSYLLENLYLVIGELPGVAEGDERLQDASRNICTNLLTQLLPCEHDVKGFLENEKELMELRKLVNR